jgi:hypothetical protein
VVSTCHGTEELQLDLPVLCQLGFSTPLAGSRALGDGLTGTSNGGDRGDDRAVGHVEPLVHAAGRAPEDPAPVVDPRSPTAFRGTVLPVLAY